MNCTYEVYVINSIYNLSFSRGVEGWYEYGDENWHSTDYFIKSNYSRIWRYEYYEASWTHTDDSGMTFSHNSLKSINVYKTPDNCYNFPISNNKKWQNNFSYTSSITYYPDTIWESFESKNIENIQDCVYSNERCQIGDYSTIMLQITTLSTNEFEQKWYADFAGYYVRTEKEGIVLDRVKGHYNSTDLEPLVKTPNVPYGTMIIILIIAIPTIMVPVIHRRFC